MGVVFRAQHAEANLVGDVDILGVVLVVMDCKCGLRDLGLKSCIKTLAVVSVTCQNRDFCSGDGWVSSGWVPV